MMLSPWINSATGIMINEANKFAARTDVVWAETTTAPLTMTIACMVVRSTTSINKTGGGDHPTSKCTPTRYTIIPK